MSEEIKLFNLPVSDISNENFMITITDAVASDTGDSIKDFMRNRNLTSGWATTDSTDAANTVIDFESSDAFNLSDIMIMGHNFKDFLVEYFDGALLQTIENVTNNTDDFYHKELSSTIITTRVRITVYGTIVSDEDKIITRIVLTEKLLTGQFVSWPTIQKPTQRLIRKDNRMLSGKHFISESSGAFSVSLRWKGVTDQADINIIERIFLFRKSFMIWLSGGDDTQFRFTMTGYNNEDIYIVRANRDYVNQYYKGMYQNMVPITIDLIEVVE